jgi:hypothetical protein
VRIKTEAERDAILALAEKPAKQVVKIRVGETANVE